MKTFAGVFLVITGLLLGISSTRAQGTVTFANSSTSLIVKMDGSSAGVSVALYWGVLGSTEAQLVQIGNSAGLAPVNGRVNAGIYTTGSATAPGTTATFQVKGWTGNYATYEAAFNAYTLGDSSLVFGDSGLFTSATGGVGGPPSAPVSLSPTMPGFVLGVPEPSTYAFFGLGLLGLVWKRFRQK